MNFNELIDFNELLSEIKEFLPFSLLVFVSFSFISWSIRFLKNCIGYRACCDSSSFFDDISDWIQERKAKKAESKRKGIVILESCVKQENEPYKPESSDFDVEDFIKQHRLCDKEALYKINLSKDKSCK